MVNFTKTEDCLGIVSVCDIVFVLISISRLKHSLSAKKIYVPLQIILETFSASAGDCKSLTRTAYFGSVVMVLRSLSAMLGLPTAMT